MTTNDRPEPFDSSVKPLMGMEIFYRLCTDEKLVEYLLSLPPDEPLFSMDECSQCAIAHWLKHHYCYAILVAIDDVEFKDYTCQRFQIPTPTWAMAFQQTFLGEDLNTRKSTARECLLALRGKDWVQENVAQVANSLPR